MALFVYDKNSNWMDEIYKNGHIPTRFFSSNAEIQREYCDCIECEMDSDLGYPFFENADVKEYLESFGVEYKGGYILKSDDWRVVGRSGEAFVTYLNYPLQMSCVMLYSPSYIYVIEKDGLFELKYLMPVLKKINVYVIIDDMYELIAKYRKCFDDFVGMGLELIVNGKSISGMSREEQMSYLYDLYDECNVLTRETDLKYFPDNYAETRIFTPYKTTYKEYVLKTTAQLNGKKHMKTEFVEMEQDNDFYKDITVVVNGKNEFDGIRRNYPVYYLYEIDDEWKYIHNSSVKYPTLSELFDEIFFTTERYDYDAQKPVDVSKAGKLLVLVLNCDENCEFNAKKYWEHAAFVAKYDKQAKIIEICDIPKGILEFHELLQKSTDLKN